MTEVIFFLAFEMPKMAMTEVVAAAADISGTLPMCQESFRAKSVNEFNSVMTLWHTVFSSFYRWGR